MNVKIGLVRYINRSFLNQRAKIARCCQDRTFQIALGPRRITRTNLIHGP